MRKPWGMSAPKLTPGELVRMPDRGVYVVHYVNDSRARVFPLTPKERTITVHEAGKAGSVIKSIQETGNATDIAPNSLLPRVEVGDLTEAEFNRLTRYIENGGQFNE